MFRSIDRPEIENALIASLRLLESSGAEVEYLRGARDFANVMADALLGHSLDDAKTRDRAAPFVIERLVGGE